jgi:hypothetical protein
MRRTCASTPTLASSSPQTLVFGAVIVGCLSTGICGGLLRAGVVLPDAISGPWLGRAAASHAFLMICAFMGTVIAIERAVALKHRAAFAAPLSSALAGVGVLAGFATAAAWLAVFAAAAFVAVNALIAVRQRAAHTALLLVAAIAWLIGNVGWASIGSAHAAVPWWFAFLVLTIAAERLEMTRLMPRRPGASAALYVVLGSLLGGCALFAVSPVWGGLVYGASLIALAGWLLCFDVARRTVFGSGLSRYMAVCLLLGYFWLAIAGVSWAATALGLPLMDAALHALALGFVFSMMLGHAPVIVPALTGIRLRFGAAFYLPLALLHASLAVRLLLPTVDVGFFAAGAAGNALALVLFAMTLAASAMAWRFRPATLRNKAQ